MDRKIDDLNPILNKITRLVAAIKFLRFALFNKEWFPLPTPSQCREMVHNANVCLVFVKKEDDTGALRFFIGTGIHAHII